MKSLRSTGSSVEAIASWRSPRLPPKCEVSVRTDRAAALVGLHDVRHRGALADHAGRRGAALVLGDQGDAGARERLAEGPALRPFVERGLEAGEGRGRASPLELLPRRPDD